MLTPALNDWRSQYQRMLRTHAHLANRFVSTIEYDDHLRHFFQDCWHLKDWIKNDPSVPPSISSVIEAEVATVKSLRIAADLANGCKHFKLDKRKREGAYVTSISATVTPEQGAETFHTGHPRRWHYTFGAGPSDRSSSRMAGDPWEAGPTNKSMNVPNRNWKDNSWASCHD